MTDGPLIVQSDKTVLLEVDHEQAGAARAAIAPFAELERAPEHVHTYRITPLALWNARAAGDWVFPNLDPIFQLGADHTTLLAAGKMTPPVGSQLYIAADWGVHSHILILWPLEAGGFFVPYEVVYEGDSVWDAAQPVADLVKHLGYPVHEERFDASMPGLNAAFMRELRPKLPMKIRHLAIPFNKFKALSYDYLRLLAHNTAADPVKHPRLSISEKGCPVLTEQLRGLQYADPDAGRIEKGDDHGPDALCAGVAPTAAKRHGKG